jgi:hypothetical protein
MALTGRDLESFTGLKNKVVMFHLHGQFSFEDVEELARVDVGVTGLAGAGRHELFDDAEFGRFDKVPTVAGGSLRASPFIVFGGFWADGLGRHVVYSG